MSRPLLLLLILPVLALILPVSVRGAGADAIYTVQNVQVDVTSTDAATARGQAFTQAQQLAFKQLAQQLYGPKGAYVKSPDDVTLATMIKDYETTNEQLSAVRYIGTYTFRFRGGAVRSYLSRQDFTPPPSAEVAATGTAPPMPASAPATPPAPSFTVASDGAAANTDAATMPPEDSDAAPAPAAEPQVNGGSGARQHAVLHFSGLSGWVAADQALRRAPGVTAVKLDSLSTNEAEVDFLYHGGSAEVVPALTQAGFQAALTPGGFDLNYSGGY